MSNEIEYPVCNNCHGHEDGCQNCKYTGRIKWTYKKEVQGAFIIRPDGSELCHVVRLESAIEICDKFNALLSATARVAELEAQIKVKVLQAQQEIVQGYYSRISMQKPDNDTILNWLEDDLQTLRMDDVVLDAEKIINAPIDPHEVSNVKCDTCNYGWLAVRPEGLTKLECPNCGLICSFDNEPPPQNTKGDDKN